MAKDGKLLTDKPSWGQKPLTDKKTQKKGLVFLKKIKVCHLLPFLLNILDSKNFSVQANKMQFGLLIYNKDEYLRSGVFYACIDFELKEKYKELVESGDFQMKFEDFLITQL